MKLWQGENKQEPPRRWPTMGALSPSRPSSPSSCLLFQANLKARPLQLISHIHGLTIFQREFHFEFLRRCQTILQSPSSTALQASNGQIDLICTLVGQVNAHLQRKQARQVLDSSHNMRLPPAHNQVFPKPWASCLHIRGLAMEICQGDFKFTKKRYPLPSL